MNEKRNILPKLSNQNINITTPENKTYTEPMSGYYPATIGFENETTGELPSTADAYDLNGGTVRVIEEIDGHKKVLELSDNNNSESLLFTNQFSSPNGTIEFWFRTNDTSKDIWITFGGDTVTYPTAFARIVLENGVWRYTDYNILKDIPNVSPPKNHTWHRITIHFRCNGAPAYKGLSINTWKCIIDGVDSGELSPRGTDESYMTYIAIRTYANFKDYSIFFDAIGYSWDPNYNVGDNLNEGLLLSYENSTALDWQGYSLDAQATKTIMGNTTIPLPNDGQHTIQIFANDSLGMNYYSDIRYFTVRSVIHIITPENTTYTEPMSGYYRALHGFECDENNNFPKGWTDNSGANAYAKVIDGIDGYNKVLECYSSSLDDSGIASSIFFDPQEQGSIEFWWYKSSSYTSAAIVDFWGEPSGVCISIRVDHWPSADNDQVQYQTGSGYLDTGYPYYSDNKWMHFRIEFNCSSDTYSLWIDKVKYLDDIDFINSIDESNIDQTRFTCYGAANAVLYYIDAVSFSWDIGYSVGDNLKEGLLLSFDNKTNLDWQGYSLDGQTNRTILGNTTIPLLHDGSHVIQVFGNDSLGTIYESSIRHFSVHHINIITPENRIYNAPMSGYYPATYGFENNEDGNFPNEWIESGVGAYQGKTTIINAYDGHNKVMHIDDDSTSVRVTADQIFNEEQSSGTIEFWAYFTSDPTKATDIRIENGTGALLTSIGAFENNWRFFNGTTDIIVPLSSIDEWFHIRIDFCSFGTYKGLTSQTYNFTIRRSNGSIYYESPTVNFHDYTLGNAARLSITSWQLAVRETWVDAVGYSWDDKYNIGDNLKEGLLLSYENSTNLDWLGYSLDGIPINTIMGNKSIPIPSDGLHSIQLFGNDSFGTNYNSEIRYFEIDLNPPLITINSPNLNDPFGALAPNFDLTIIDNNRNTTWYTLNDGIINTTFTGLSGTISQTEWDKLTDGPVTITFYANDSFGRLGYAEVIVQTDMTIPVITINSPKLNYSFGTLAPDFDLTIDEINLDLIWYTIEGGATKFFITGLNGTINQEMWNSRPNGLNTLRFSANDTVANLGFTEIIIEKDAADPIITISFPNEGDIFTTTPPTFNLSIIESNLDSIWYTIDEGPNSIICSCNGQIDYQFWLALEPREHTLCFYANDTLSNVGFIEVVIVKGEVVTFKQYYSPFFIFLIIAVGLVGLIWFINKKYK